MKIIKWFFFILFGLAALILIIALLLPKSVNIVSQSEINLPVNKVYYSLATFSDHASWDPWIQKDTTAKITLTPAVGYVGTKYSWTSKKSGAGEMVIDSVVSNQHISIKLTFTGMSSKPKVWYDLSAKDGKTLVSWGFYQDAPYPVGRIIMAFLKNKLQADYDNGMANLKKLLEEKGVKMSSLSEIRVEQIPGFYAMVVEGSGTMDELNSKMAAMFTILIASTQSQGLEITGTLFNHYISFDRETGITRFEVGFPVNKIGKSGAEVKAITVQPFSALEALHTGPYTEFGDSYSKFMKYITEQKLNVAMDAWEFYLTDPQAEPDELKWRTLIAFPLKK
jgi:effector-binding domain-containing protein